MQNGCTWLQIRPRCWIPWPQDTEQADQELQADQPPPAETKAEVNKEKVIMLQKNNILFTEGA